MDDDEIIEKRIIDFGEEFTYRSYAYTIERTDGEYIVTQKDLLSKESRKVEFPESIDTEKLSILLQDPKSENWTRASELVPTRIQVVD